MRLMYFEFTRKIKPYDNFLTPFHYLTMPVPQSLASRVNVVPSAGIPSTGFSLSHLKPTRHTEGWRGRCLSYQASSRETSPAIRERKNGEEDLAISRATIYHGSLYLIFCLICQVYSLANLNTNVDANEDSLFLQGLCAEA